MLHNYRSRAVLCESINDQLPSRKINFPRDYFTLLNSILRLCRLCTLVRSFARPFARHTCASQVREYLAPPRRPHGRYMVTMKGVAFEDQKLLVLPSALSYDWLLPGVENGGPWWRPRRTPFRVYPAHPVPSDRLGFLWVSSFLGVFRARNVKDSKPFRSRI